MKDPAFLFYFRDFKSSTENMTNCQRGAYIQLMCIQAENGYVLDQHMKKICSNICYDTMQIKLDLDTYNVMKTKFIEKTPGSCQLVNLRLEEEINKRAKYCESRRKNKLSKNKTKNNQTYDVTYDNSFEKHMSPHMVNGNINENRNRNNLEKGVQGEKQNVKIFGPNSPKFNDPVQAGLDPITGDGTDWNLFCFTYRIKPDSIPDKFETYQLSCQSQDIARTKKQHLAAFAKWCLTWDRNERSNPTKNGEKTNQEKVDELIQKLESQMI